MTLKQIEYFLDLCQTLNFAKTAEKLYTTQPSISRQIRKMEEEMEVTLFYRHSRKVELTRAGHYLRIELQRIMGELETAVQNARRLEKQPEELVRVGVCDLAEIPSLPKAMRVFHEQYPMAHIELRIAGFQAIVESMRKNELDIACCMRAPAARLTDTEQHLLRRGYFYCIVPSDSPLRNYKRLTLEQIQGYPWIFRDKDNSTPMIAWLQKTLQEHWPDNPVLYSASPAQSALMVRAGFGISIVVSYSVEPGPDFTMIPFEVPADQDLSPLDLIVFWKNAPENHLTAEFGSLVWQIQQELDGQRAETQLWPERTE